MDISFKDQVVVITGAGGALGRTYALEIARRGGAIVANDLGCDFRGNSSSRAVVDSVVDEIRANGGRAIANYDTVAEKGGGEALLRFALDSFGRVDALINNAGNIRNALFEELTDADRDAMLAVHVAGAFNVTQPIYREMKRNGYGRILFTSSASGLLGNTTQTGYGAAKSAVIGLMNCIALEGEPHGILCNALLPSSATRMAESMLPEIMARIGAASVKFHSSLTPANVSPLAVYLVSRDCVSTHGIYSAVGNRFSRAFIGMTRGWMAPQGQIPSVEEISAHFGEISDPTNYEILNNLTEEYESIARRL